MGLFLSQLDDCNHATEFKNVFWSMLFHALILGRRRFGQQGWSRIWIQHIGLENMRKCTNKPSGCGDTNTQRGGVLVPWDDLRRHLVKLAWRTYADFGIVEQMFHTCSFFNQKLLESGKHLAPGFPLPNGKSH